MDESDQIVIDGITVDLVDPALCTPMPTSSDVLHRPDRVAEAATVLTPSGAVLTAMQSLLPDRLDTASELTSRLWDTFELLRDGHLSYVHARILATATEELPDGIVAKVQAQVLKRAPGQTPGEFRAAVRRAIAKHDAKSQNEKHRDAAAQRHVRKEQVEDGMGWINLFAPADGIETVWTAVNAWGQKTSREDQRTADQRRADALVDICTAALAMPGLPAEHGLRPTVNVTLAASTLAGHDDQPGYLNGEAVPADIARRVASQRGAKRYYWPVDDAGRLLDTSLVTDQYQPTAAIARHVITRDQRCVMPGCRRGAHRCQLDHRTPWPAGQTSAENLEPLCKRHHDLKHHAGWTLTRSRDGQYHWTSATRHHYRYRPPELPVPKPPPPASTGPDPNDEAPPF